MAAQFSTIRTYIDIKPEKLSGLTVLLIRLGVRLCLLPIRAEQNPLSDQLMAAAMGLGIKANKDGSFDVKSLLGQDPVTAAGKIGQMIMSELLGGGDVPSGIPGLNSLLAASWNGWDMPAPVAEPEPEAPAPAPADPNVSW